MVMPSVTLGLTTMYRDEYYCTKLAAALLPEWTRETK